MASICGRAQGRDASDIVNELDETELADIIWRFGEERASRRIAKRLSVPVWMRASSATDSWPILSIRSCRAAQPGQADGATRTFQALRIYINGELEELETALADCEKLLAPNGILAIVSFHSLEDRIETS